MTRIAVLGCGAIGSLYAAHLTRAAGVEVWAVDPWREHVEAIRSGGLRVTGRAGFTAAVNAVADAADLPPCDLGIVATKAHHTREAVAAAKEALADAGVVSVQNGLGNEELIAELLPRVMRGSIMPAGALTGPGVVRFDAPGDTWIGPFEPSPARPGEVTQLAEMLTQGGLPTFGVADARPQQWAKVVFNAATSPLSALTGLTVGQVCTDPGLRAEVDRLIDEALQVCAKAGIEPAGDPRRAIDEAVAIAYDHRPSMLQDVSARRRTEIAVLNGGVAAEGRRAGVPTPAHDTMVALVSGLESQFGNGPDKRWTSP